MLAIVREIGSVGVISDVAAWDLPPNALTDGRNFRVAAGKVSASGGSELVSTKGSDKPDIDVSHSGINSLAVVLSLVS